MAIPNWLTITPTEGNGNVGVEFKGTEHTGRSMREYMATVKNTKVANCTITAQQSGAEEFITMQQTASPAKTAGNLTITGTSNAAQITFSWKQTPAPTLIVELPTQYTAAGTTVDNGAAITNDPGTSQAFQFSIVLSVPENETISTKSAELIATTGSGKTATCEITQAAGDPYLYVVSEGTTETSITLPADGATGVTVQILSNDSWSIE